MPLQKLLQNKALQSEWKWNESLNYARVIHYYGIWPPSKFWEASDEDRAWAVAHYETEMGIQAWDSHIARIKHESEMANLSTSRD